MAAPIDISTRTTLVGTTPEPAASASMTAPVADAKADLLGLMEKVARGLDALDARAEATPAPAGAPPRTPSSRSILLVVAAVGLGGAWMRAESAHEIATETRVAQASRDGEEKASREAEAKRIADAEAKLAELKQAQIDAIDLFTDSNRASLQLQIALWRKVAPGEEPPVDTSKESREERERRLRLRLEPK